MQPSSNSFLLLSASVLFFNLEGRTLKHFRTVIIIIVSTLVLNVSSVINSLQNCRCNNELSLDLYIDLSWTGSVPCTLPRAKWCCCLGWAGQGGGWFLCIICRGACGLGEHRCFGFKKPRVVGWKDGAWWREGLGKRGLGWAMPSWQL